MWERRGRRLGRGGELSAWVLAQKWGGGHGCLGGAERSVFRGSDAV